MTEKIGYKLNPKKLKGAPQSILPYVVGAFYYTEDFEYFDIIKPYLDIPEPRKSLEEISQEFDEKIDELLVKTQRKFAVSKESAEYHYNRKFNRIIEDFEYAKTYGQFPPEPILTYSDGLSSSNFTTSFVIKQGGNEVGYYTFGNRKSFRYYMNEKPNAVVRFFMKVCLGFFWVDEK
jgi:hypothetical protein